MYHTYMKLFKFSEYQLRVLSSFFVNLSAAWFIALFVTSNIVSQITNFILAILSLEVAFEIEKANLTQ